MKRQWNFVNDRPGSGQRYAEALGCISTEPYVRLTCAAHEAVQAGESVQIAAVRGKYDADGKRLEDFRDPGDYATVGYSFEIGAEAAEIEREPNYEGEQAATDYARALGLAADRDFCEAMVQAKCLLDRIGGQLFLRPYSHEGQVVGVLAHYEHLIRGAEKEPDASLEDPPPLPGDEEDGPQSVDAPPDAPPSEPDEGADSPVPADEVEPAEVAA